MNIEYFFIMIICVLAINTYMMFLQLTKVTLKCTVHVNSPKFMQRKCLNGKFQDLSVYFSTFSGVIIPSAGSGFFHSSTETPSPFVTSKSRLRRRRRLQHPKNPRLRGFGSDPNSGCNSGCNSGSAVLVVALSYSAFSCSKLCPQLTVGSCLAFSFFDVFFDFFLSEIK